MNTTIILTDIYEDESGNTYYFDIKTDGRKVGTASVRAADMDDDHAYVEGIDIDEEYQNQGIGTAALHQISGLWYGVEIAPDNEDARRLYARLGSLSDWDVAPYLDQGYGVYRI